MEGASQGPVSLLVVLLNVLHLLGLGVREAARGRKERATIQTASSRAEGKPREISGGFSKRRGGKRSKTKRRGEEEQRSVSLGSVMMKRGR